MYRSVQPVDRNHLCKQRECRQSSPIVTRNRLMRLMKVNNITECSAKITNNVLFSKSHLWLIRQWMTSHFCLPLVCYEKLVSFGSIFFHLLTFFSCKHRQRNKIYFFIRWMDGRSLSNYITDNFSISQTLFSYSQINSIDEWN